MLGEEGAFGGLLSAALEILLLVGVRIHDRALGATINGNANPAICLL